MPEKPENRVERIVSDLLRGRRLRLRAGDAEEKEAITAAARFAAASQGPQRMSPAFRRRLADILESTPRETWLTRRAAMIAGLGVAAGADEVGVDGAAGPRCFLRTDSGPMSAPSRISGMARESWSRPVRSARSFFAAGSRCRPSRPCARTCLASFGGRASPGCWSVHATRCRSRPTGSRAARRTRCRISTRSRLE